MTATDVGMLIADLVILVFLLYLASFKSYFDKKGENFATKEDIEEITALVEGVKSQMQYELYAKQVLKDLEREALVDYYSKLHVWLRTAINYGAFSSADDEASEIKVGQTTLDALMHDFELATGKMELFVDNPEITQNHFDVLEEMMNFVGFGIDFGYKIRMELLRSGQVMNETSRQQKVQKHAELLATRREMYEEFRKEKLERYKKLLPFVSKHRTLIAHHLKELINT